MINKYTESSIKHFTGLQGVRKRPAMYIGGTDAFGLHHLVWEILDNSIDEALAGEVTEIEVELNKNNWVSILDNGRGIPAGKHKSGRNTLELVFTELHAGGKFGEKGSAYYVAGGLHGVGAAVVNALSKYLQVEVWRDGKHYSLTFGNGGQIEKQIQTTKCDNKLRGTKVTFIPDPKIFKKLQLDPEIIKQRLMESAFIMKNLRIKFINHCNNEEHEYYYENNLVDYLNHLKKSDFICSPITIKDTIEDVYIETALSYTNETTTHVLSFVNNIHTSNGGTHESGMLSGLTKAINKAMQDLSFSKKLVERREVREGLYAIIIVRLPSSMLEFEGQTKMKLRTPSVRYLVEKTIMKLVTDYLFQNKRDAEAIFKKVLLAYDAREAARKAREKITNIKSLRKEKGIFSDKLTLPQVKDKKKNELFIVEGDSAGGTAKLGRDKKYQAILPLRGKPLNVERSKLTDVIKNEEFSTLIYAIGCGILEDCNPKYSNYNKVIIMTDADTDGAHIQTLLLTFFTKYMREMIEAGKIYIAQPPLYKIKFGKTERYLWEDQELKKYRKKYQDLVIQRYKGLGEMNDDQLWETTMNPKNRVLLKVVIDNKDVVETTMKKLMGNDVIIRREWIEGNVDFGDEDGFTEFLAKKSIKQNIKDEPDDNNDENN